MAPVIISTPRPVRLPREILSCVRIASRSNVGRAQVVLGVRSKAESWQRGAALRYKACAESDGGGGSRRPAEMHAILAARCRRESAR
jgi:hypothetical protein